MFQHTAARRRLATRLKKSCLSALFQHTAARRRLGNTTQKSNNCFIGFNTQPPEGGWWAISGVMSLSFWFQHTAARRRLARRLAARLV